MKVGGWHAAYGMENEIELSPAFGDGTKNSVEFVRRIYVAGMDNRCFQPRFQGRHVGFGALIDISYGKFGVGLPEMQGSRPR